MQKQIKQIWHFDQSPGEVWDYLTKPELMEQWLMKTDFKPIKGEKFTFRYNPKSESNCGSESEGIVFCEVLEIIPFSKLSYSWNGSSPDKSRNFNSVVEWILIPNENGTELQLSHHGFTSEEDIIMHSNGWNSCVTKLENLLK